MELSRPLIKKTPSTRLTVGASIAAALLSGYSSRQAFAGSCTGSLGTYICSGAAGVDTTQSLTANSLTVTTSSGFGLNVGAGHGLTLINSTGSLSFTDNFMSSITGSSTGIDTYNSGSGATSITSTGMVTGGDRDGIYAYNALTTSDITINAASVSGGRYGINVANYGTGATSITSSGTVTGTDYEGINVLNYGTNLTINSINVSGGEYGIHATNGGTGTTSITSTGMVTGGDRDGIYAFNAPTTSDITINAANISGNNSGIRMKNRGTGNTSITTTGTVTSANSYGIYAYNASSASDIILSVSSISGHDKGVFTKNLGSGSTSISSTGAVTSADDIGVYAYNAPSASDITFNTASVTGYSIGLHARNKGGGNVIITSTGTVTGEHSDGIHTYNGGINLTVNATNVLGDINGIRTLNKGSGNSTITSTGTVTGTTYHGINAYNYSPASGLTVNAANVSGAIDGINADNRGTGTTSITVNGTVTGGTNAGIYNQTDNTTTITLNSGATVSAISGTAIEDKAGDTILTLNSGASITGIIDLGGGEDAIVLAGGNFSGVTQFVGGTGTNDNLTFSGSTGTFDPTLMAGIETVIFDNGSTMGLTFTSNTFDASGLTGSALIVQNGGVLNAAGGFTLTGNLTNSSGVMSLQNNTIDAAATINGNFTGGGRLLIDANFATDTADTLTITGDVLAGGTAVSVNDISSGPATGANITLISVGGTTTGGDFTLASSVVNGAFDYNILALDGSDWVLQSSAFTGGGGAPVFTPIASSFEAISQSLLTLETLPSFADRTRNRVIGANSGDSVGFDSPLWMRIVGGKRDIDSHRSTTGADFDTTHWLAQIGADFTLSDTPSAQFVLGVNAGYGRAKTTVSATAGNSKIDTDNYTVGVSATWLIANGAYVDLQAQKSWYETDLSAGGVGAGNVNDIDGDGYSVSVEVGHVLTLSDTLSITPQAQLIYSRVDTDNFTGANAEQVKLEDSKSLKARLGAELNKQLTDDGATHGFVLAHVIREFEDETQVNVSGAQLANSVDKWSGELGIGLTHAWGKGTTHYELFAAVTAGTSLNHVGDSNSVEGELGFKAHF
ncbi:MAG: hypothetical protein COA95_05720 [Methylophaga sp.]|nr:MAG: hypothetical protein COA95_05720 [Methylophaga sp.]